MQTLPSLKPGDTVEIVAPASRCTEKQLMQLKELLNSWELNCLIDEAIFGDDLLCANRDEKRFESLKNALLRDKTKAIICARGGYGSMRLVPALSKLAPPKSPKLFLGMSDITALHLFFLQHWQWPVLHGALALDKFSPESIAAHQDFLFGKTKQVEWRGEPLNNEARQSGGIIKAPIIGGNLTLIQASIGTLWQLNCEGRILLIEDTGERGYRIDRILEHLRQANIFHKAKAILVGDFIKGKEPNGSCLVSSVLQRFAESMEVPVVRVKGIGHDYTNFPMPLGVPVSLSLDTSIKLICAR